MIRRKSNAVIKPATACESWKNVEHEMANQRIHQHRLEDPDHDRRVLCWCCCEDCNDLVWYHPPKRGPRSSPPMDNGEPPSTQETCDESPTSPGTSTS